MKFFLATAASLAAVHAQSVIGGYVSPTFHSSPLRRYSITNWNCRLVRSAEEVHLDHTPDIKDTEGRWDVAYSKAAGYLQRFDLTQKVRCVLRLYSTF